MLALGGRFFRLAIFTLARVALAIGAVNVVAAAARAVFVAFATRTLGIRFHGSGHGGFSGSCSFRITAGRFLGATRCLIRTASGFLGTAGRFSGVASARFADAIGTGANIVETARATGFTLSTRASGERAADFGADACGADACGDVTV